MATIKNPYEGKPTLTISCRGCSKVALVQNVRIMASGVTYDMVRTLEETGFIKDGIYFYCPACSEKRISKTA